MSKKTILSALLGLSTTWIFGQYEPGNLELNMGGGFGLYGGSSNDDDQDTTSGPDAGSSLIELGFSYSVQENFAVGLNIERNGFLTDNDTVTEDNYGYSYNIRLSPAYRFVNKEKTCFYVRGLVGVSFFKYGNHYDNSWVKSTGLSYGLELGWQHHFTEKVGMYINSGWAGYSYAKLTDHNGDVLRNNQNTEDLYLRLNGVNTRLGLVVRF